MMGNTNFHVRPTGEALGADIVGLDLSGDVPVETVAGIQAALATHLVLRFRSQALDEDRLIAFSGAFGPLDPAPTRPANVPHHPTRREINVLSNIVIDGSPVGGLGNSELVWHQDMTYKDVPPMASVLYGIETPARGGDTLFYNLQKAFESLPRALRDQVRGLSCKHDATRNSAGELRAGFEAAYAHEARPGAVHPLVLRHPATGRESLYLGRRRNAWVVGLPEAESDGLLDALWAHIETGDHYWAQRWQPGDVVIWDNRFTLHRRDTLDPAQRRLMYRTQVRDAAGPAALQA